LDLCSLLFVAFSFHSNTITHTCTNSLPNAYTYTNIYVDVAGSYGMARIRSDEY